MAVKKGRKSTINIITNLNDSNLNQDIKNQLIDQIIANQPERDKGLFDHVFGRNHPDLYVAWSIVIAILLIGGLCSYLFRVNVNAVKELWQIFIPALTLVIGYVLGSKKQDK